MMGLIKRENLLNALIRTTKSHITDKAYFGAVRSLFAAENLKYSNCYTSSFYIQNLKTIIDQTVLGYLAGNPLDRFSYDEVRI